MLNPLPAAADNSYAMTSERVINARHLTGDGPLWMLYEQARDAEQAQRIRLIISQEQTAAQIVAALVACGLSANLDPIGDEFHVICRGEARVSEAVREWLEGRAPGGTGRRREPGVPT